MCSTKKIGIKIRFLKATKQKKYCATNKYLVQNGRANINDYLKEGEDGCFFVFNINQSVKRIL